MFARIKSQHPRRLKNAIDWASRPAFNSVIKDNPVTIITQANSPVGGARAQAHIKLIFDSTLSILYQGRDFSPTKRPL
ncbi:NAD(P)H-dependent oxidoreductase [Marinomonas algicola]|uniref:NADPH-dependent FMN reductase n=1 Tax=Marinomonas algicola TaxID=2773454 RepID=UPI00174C9326